MIAPWRRRRGALAVRSGAKPPAGRFAAFQPAAQALLAEPAPVRYRATLYLLLAFVLAALVFACLARVDRIVIAPGKVVSARRNLAIAPLETGVVREVFVSAGQSVAKGDALASLDPTFAEAGLAGQEGAWASLAAKVWRLRCETSGQCAAPADIPASELALERGHLLARRQERAARADSLEQRVRELSAKAATNAAETVQAGKQIALARDLERMYGDIERQGAGSRLELMKAQSSRIEAEGRVAKLKNEAAELRESLARAGAEKQDFLENWNAEAARDLAQASRELAAAGEERRKAARLTELVVLRAPEDGVVLDVAAQSAGAVARQGEPLLTIVPRGEELVVEAEVAAQDIGLVRPDDAVRLKFEAFPYQRHGTGTGRLLTISPDAFDRQSAEGQRVFYRVRVAVAEARLAAVPPDFHLFPGMTVSAEIKVGSRRVITYLLYPLLRAFDESLREP